MGLKGYSLGTKFDVWSALKSEERDAVNSLNVKLEEVRINFTNSYASITNVYRSNGENSKGEYAVPVSKSLGLGTVLGASKKALEHFREEFERVTGEVHEVADLLPNTFYTEYRAFGKTFGGSGKIAKTKKQYADTLRKVKIQPLLDEIDKTRSFLKGARSILEPVYTVTDTHKAVEASITELEKLEGKFYELNNNLAVTENVFRCGEPYTLAENRARRSLNHVKAPSIVEPSEMVGGDKLPGEKPFVKTGTKVRRGW